MSPQFPVAYLSKFIIWPQFLLQSFCLEFVLAICFLRSSKSMPLIDTIHISADPGVGPFHLFPGDQLELCCDLAGSCTAPLGGTVWEASVPA